MSNEPKITEEAIRNTLIERATAFRERAGCSFSHMSKEALNDSKFIGEVIAGRNFTIRSYQKMNDWLDEAEKNFSETAA